MKNLLLKLLFSVFAFISLNTIALDTVKLLRPEWNIANQHADFKDAVLKKVMEITEKEFGPYKFVMNPIVMNRSRSLRSLIKGDTHNVYITPAQQEWDNNTIAIKIPIRLGLLSYRLLLIHKNDLALFSEVKTIEQLKALTVGLRSKWLTTKIFRNENFNMVESEDYNRLFLLLDKHKFHYFPRSIYEIYNEVADRSLLLENIVVEPTLALYIPTATYIYVSPTEARLAQRITKGLTLLFERGKLTELVEEFYGEAIIKAHLQARKIITIENPYYLEVDRLNDQKYLYKP